MIRQGQPAMSATGGKSDCKSKKIAEAKACQPMSTNGGISLFKEGKVRNSIKIDTQSRKRFLSDSIRFVHLSEGQEENKFLGRPVHGTERR